MRRFTLTSLLYRLSRGLFGFGLFLVTICSCSSGYNRSLGGDPELTYTRVFLADYNTAWGSILTALKSYSIDVNNREGGFIQTRWTSQTSVSENFGDTPSFHDTKYRLKLNISNVFYNGKPAVKISIQKDQRVQRDVLEGWRSTETDGIQEQTLLYRIERLIFIKSKITELEEQRINNSIDGGI